MKRIALMVLALAALAGCTDEPGARKALAGAGFKDVSVTGYTLWGCDEKDTFHTGFEARGPSGQFVTGVVCSGWMKGATIRFD